MTIPAAESSVDWSFATEDNDIDEPDKTLSLRILHPGNVTFRGEEPHYIFEANVVSVTDNDLLVVTIEQLAAGVREGSPAQFTLTRQGLTDTTFTVNVSVTTAGDLFPSADPPSTVTLAEGFSTAILTVQTLGDTAVENHGSVTAAVTAGDDYRTGEPASATIGVADDDRGA